MKVVILAGGLGTRLSEETVLRPKPMVEIGGRPVIWHIMKHYAHYGFKEFIICLGYKGYMIKEYFMNYFIHNSDITVDLKRNELTVHRTKTEDWKITLPDTGDDTMTGGRLARVKHYIGNETFMFTYGDGVSNVNLSDLLCFHRNRKKLATVTAVRPLGRFGAIEIGTDGTVDRFQEKPLGDNGWINGGFFVLEPGVIDYIAGDHIHFEREPLEKLTAECQLAAFQHAGFWQAMDTVRDRNLLEDLWKKNPPWKVWEDQ